MFQLVPAACGQPAPSLTEWVRGGDSALLENDKTEGLPAACGRPARRAAPTPTLPLAPPTIAPARCTWRASPRAAACRTSWPPCECQACINGMPCPERSCSRRPEALDMLSAAMSILRGHGHSSGLALAHPIRPEFGHGGRRVLTSSVRASGLGTHLLTAAARTSTSAASRSLGSSVPQWNPVTPSCNEQMINRHCADIQAPARQALHVQDTPHFRQGCCSWLPLQQPASIALRNSRSSCPCCAAHLDGVDQAASGSDNGHCAVLHGQVCET